MPAVPDGAVIDESPARMGVEQGIGSKANAYFDKLTEAWIFVEFAGYGPSTPTTILSGKRHHDNHNIHWVHRLCDDDPRDHEAQPRP
jgi:hypothetical protein